VRGDPLPLAGDRAPHRARRAGGDGQDLGRGDHGRAPQALGRHADAGRGRAVPPGVDHDAGRQGHAEELPRAMELTAALARVLARRDLTSDEIAAVFGRVMDGEATPAQIGGLLVALRMKGETPDEIAGAARAMRARATPIVCPEPERAVDTCGTGGDGSGSINVSTIAAIVTAACPVRVAKHGNRALSSRAGSADVLEALGVVTQAPVAVLERCLADAGICFMFAPAFHSATRHAAGPRRELGTRTLFNLL